MFQIVKAELKKTLPALLQIPAGERVTKRIEKFCSMGVFVEG
jgi:acetyl-CoA carboxylase alpha subunit